MTKKTAEKKLKGFQHLINAAKWSLQGFKSTFSGEAAFRQELLIFLILFPLSFYIGESPLEVTLLILPLFLVLIVELINTAIESAIDRFGDEHHELSGRAKDIGSAAVFLSVTLAILVWVILIF